MQRNLPQILAALLSVAVLMPGAARAAWVNISFTPQTGAFIASFDATPSKNNADIVIGLSKSAAAAYTAVAAIVRFNPSGIIDVRNGSVYASDIIVSYTANISHHFRMVVNVPAHTYRVYVTPQGGTEITLASNYAFRTEQATVTSLANVAEIGDAPAPVRSFSIIPAPDTTPPAVPLNLAGTAVSSSRINLAWNASTDNVAVTGYKIYRNGLKVGTSAITSYSDTGLSGSTAYNYTVSAYDATGNNSAPSSAGISVKTLPIVITSGCGKAASVGYHATTIMVNGKPRTYDYFVPIGYNPNTLIPLTLHFHGAGANGLAMYNGGMDADAAAAGNKMISIYPDGLKYGGTTGWDLSKTGVDLALFDALLSWAESKFCIDPQLVFVAGFSWGHDFANTLTCYRGDKIRAVNGWSGSMYNTGCVAHVPAYRATYSSPDGTDAYSQAEINRAINYYKTAHACTSVTQPASPGTSPPCLAYQGCATPVNFCPYLNMGHRVPPGGWVHAWAFFKSFISSPP